jgi:hypothetical protein
VSVAPYDRTRLGEHGLACRIVTDKGICLEFKEREFIVRLRAERLQARRTYDPCARGRQRLWQRRRGRSRRAASIRRMREMQRPPRQWPGPSENCSFSRGKQSESVGKKKGSIVDNYQYSTSNHTGRSPSYTLRVEKCHDAASRHLEKCYSLLLHDSDLKLFQVTTMKKQASQDDFFFELENISNIFQFKKKSS